MRASAPFYFKEAKLAQDLLKGVRVLALEQLHVLPLGTAFLADFGAEVIRIESLDHVADRRGGPYPDNNVGDEWWNETGSFTYMNRNKESLCLDVTHPKGKEIFYKLVKNADVVCDNFRPGTMKRLGFDHESLTKINPKIITLSCTAYGHTGPWRAAGARARTVDAASGLTQLTGYEGGPPVRASSNYMDHTGGNQNAYALLLAIYRVRKTGQGSRLDVSMQENGTQSIGPAILEGQRGFFRPRLDTGHLWKSPHHVYPCSGEDHWIAISVSSNEEWTNLKQAMENPSWANDHKFDTAAGRHDDRLELDKKLGEWTKQWDFVDLTHILQGQGVTAGGAWTAAEISEDPHLNERNFFHWFDNPKQPQVGPRKFQGRSFQISGIPVAIESSANLGEHNAKVLKELGGLSDKEIAALYDIGILAERPRPTEDKPVANPNAVLG